MVSRPISTGHPVDAFSPPFAAAVGALLGGWALQRFSYGPVAAAAALVVIAAALSARAVTARAPQAA